jgi:GTP pyrophosphokinase
VLAHQAVRGALQALQIFSPMGHALGLSVVSSAMEDSSLSILFPSAYAEVQGWVARMRSGWLAQLTRMQSVLTTVLEGDEVLAGLGVATSATVRAKSAFSMMKKLLSLSGTASLHLAVS